MSALTGVFGTISAPIFVVVAVIGAFIGVLIYLWKTNENFRNTAEAWNGVKTAVSGAIQGVVGWLTELWQNPIDITTDNAYIASIRTNIHASLRCFGNRHYYKCYEYHTRFVTNYNCVPSHRNSDIRSSPNHSRFVHCFNSVAFMATSQVLGSK